MKKIIVDSSVIVKWLSSENELLLEQADLLLTHTTNGKVELFASELAKYEVGQVMTKNKHLPLPQGMASLATLYALPINFLPDNLERATTTHRLAVTNDLTYYDASFATLAKELDATLVTDNVKHQGKIGEIKTIPLAKYR